MENVKNYLINSEAKYIKLGANHGAGFIFCGTPQDAIEFLPGYNEREYQRLLDRTNYYKDEIDNFDERYEALIERNLKYWRKSEGKNSKFKTEEDYKDYLLNDKPKALERVKKIHKRYLVRTKMFTDVETREIVDIYSSILDNNKGCKDEIVVYEGYEPGAYWTLEEFEEDKGEADKNDI